MTGTGPHTLIVSQLPPPVHGSAIMTLRLVEALEGAGRRVSVVDKRFSRDADDVGVVRLAKVVAVPELLRRLHASLVADRPDECVYFLTNRPGSFLVDVAALAVIRARRVPVVLSLHTAGYAALAGRGPVWAALVRRVLGSARTVVTLGPRLVADLDGLVRPERVAVVRNADDGPPPGPPPAREGAHVLFLSNLLPEKGVNVFIRTAAALVAARPDLPWRFDIAGAGSDRRLGEIRTAVRDAGLAERSTVHGAVAGEAKWHLLQRATVLLFPSTYPLEAQPLTIVEAFSVGTPVVAYDVGGVGDLVVPGATGGLVEPGDEAGLTASVLEVIEESREPGYREAISGFHDRHHSMRAFRLGWEGVLGGRATQGPEDFAADPAALRRLVRADWRANPRNWRIRAVLVAFRLAQLALGGDRRLGPRSVLPVALYRLWTEGLLGMELPPKTRVGGGLTIWHGYAMVVNDHAVIGRGVTLRNGVTIGQRAEGGPCPRIGDGVVIGAGALILGGIAIGDGARVGAGAVVLQDVPAGRTAVGNPARLLPAADGEPGDA